MRLFSGMFADLYSIKRLKQTPAARGGQADRERACLLL